MHAASKLLKPKGESKSLLDPFYRWFNRGFERATEIYISIAKLILRRWIIGLALIAMFTGGVVWLGKNVPSGFVPEEDQGYIMVSTTLRAALATAPAAGLVRPAVCTSSRSYCAKFDPRYGVES